MTSKLKKEGGLKKELIFLLLLSLMVLPAAGAQTQTFNFTMQNNTGLSFENGSYMIEVVELAQPFYVTVNLTDNNRSEVRNIYDSEAPITFDQIKLGASFITETSAMITIEFPDGWGAPKKYQIAVAQAGVPNIVLTKSADKTNVNVGDVLQIKIIAENKGNGTAYNLTLIEPLLPNGLTIAPTSRTPVIKDKLDPGEIDDQPYYGVTAIESGTFNIEPTIVKYGSKTSKSNSLTITVAAATQEKSNLTTVINLDKKNVTIGEQIKATVNINNTGKAPAKFVRIDFTPPIGLEIIEGNLRIDDNIQPGMPIERRITLKATETGNYSINLRTVYNDDPIGLISNSEPIVVTEKEGNYLYIFVPVIIILVGIILFTIKRHREYSY